MASFYEALREFNTLSRRRGQASLTGIDETRFQALLSYFENDHEDRDPPELSEITEAAPVEEVAAAPVAEGEAEVVETSEVAEYADPVDVEEPVAAAPTEDAVIDVAPPAEPEAVVEVAPAEEAPAEPVAAVEAAPAEEPRTDELIDVSVSEEVEAAPEPTPAPAESEWVIVEEQAEAAVAALPPEPEPVAEVEVAPTEDAPVVEAEVPAPVEAVEAEQNIDIDVDLAAEELLSSTVSAEPVAADWMAPPDAEESAPVVEAAAEEPVAEPAADWAQPAEAAPVAESDAESIGLREVAAEEPAPEPEPVPEPAYEMPTTDQTIRLEANEVARLVAQAAQLRSAMPTVAADPVPEVIDTPVPTYAEPAVSEAELLAFATGESNEPDLRQQVSSQLGRITPPPPAPTIAWQAPVTPPTPAWAETATVETPAWAPPAAPAWAEPVAPSAPVWAEPVVAAAPAWAEPVPAAPVWAEPVPSADAGWQPEAVPQWQAAQPAAPAWAEPVAAAPAWSAPTAPMATPAWAEPAAPAWSASAAPVAPAADSWSAASSASAWSAPVEPEAPAWQPGDPAPEWSGQPAETWTDQAPVSTPAWTGENASWSDGVEVNSGGDDEPMQLASAHEFLDVSASVNGGGWNREEPKPAAPAAAEWGATHAENAWSDPEAWSGSTAPEIAALPQPAIVAGEHRVVLHTLEGSVKRGIVIDIDLNAPSVSLWPGTPGGAAEEIAITRAKALFFLLQPGEHAQVGVGRRVKITFVDGRQVEGILGEEMGQGFFLLPIDARTNTARVYVLSHAVRSVV